MHSKVMIVISDLELAGAQKVVAHLAANMDKAQTQISILVLSKARDTIIERQLRQQNIQLHFLNKPAGLHLPTFWKAAKYVHTYKPDVIHTHLNGWMYVFPAAWCRKIKILHTIHSRAARQEASGALRKLVTFLYHRKVMVPVAISDEIKSEATQVYRLGAEQVEMVYNPVDYRAFADTPKQQHDGVVFVNVARFSKVKNQLFLIRAFAKAYESNSDIRLAMAGEGALLETAKELTRELGIADAVEFLGNVENVPQLLARCDVFVLPSIAEGLPISMLEAEATGLPVIASRVGGIPDIFNGNGCLVEVNDEAGLVDAMLLLAKDEALRREMGQKSQSIAKTYAADAIAPQYEALYQKYRGETKCVK
ncbi:MAG: glycosyltransferase [Oscillospiraceae bacterium]|nr:glycosyltransferase [Oscillospiraceae bacterium]